MAGGFFPPLSLFQAFLTWLILISIHLWTFLFAATHCWMAVYTCTCEHTGISSASCQCKHVIERDLFKARALCSAQQPHSFSGSARPQGRSITNTKGKERGDNMTRKYETKWKGSPPLFEPPWFHYISNAGILTAQDEQVNTERMKRGAKTN